MPTYEEKIPAANSEISLLYHGLSTCYWSSTHLPSMQPKCYDYDVPAIAASNGTQLVKGLTTIQVPHFQNRLGFLLHLSKN